jgi:hypothetical protein
LTASLATAQNFCYQQPNSQYPISVWHDLTPHDLIPIEGGELRLFFSELIPLSGDWGDFTSYGVKQGSMAGLPLGVHVEN